MGTASLERRRPRRAAEAFGRVAGGGAPQLEEPGRRSCSPLRERELGQRPRHPWSVGGPCLPQGPAKIRAARRGRAAPVQVHEQARGREALELARVTPSLQQPDGIVEQRPRATEVAGLELDEGETPEGRALAVEVLELAAEPESAVEAAPRLDQLAPVPLGHTEVVRGQGLLAAIVAEREGLLGLPQVPRGRHQVALAALDEGAVQRHASAQGRHGRQVVRRDGVERSPSRLPVAVHDSTREAQHRRRAGGVRRRLLQRCEAVLHRRAVPRQVGRMSPRDPRTIPRLTILASEHLLAQPLRLRGIRGQVGCEQSSGRAGRGREQSAGREQVAGLVDGPSCHQEAPDQDAGALPEPGVVGSLHDAACQVQCGRRPSLECEALAVLERSLEVASLLEEELALLRTAQLRVRLEPGMGPALAGRCIRRGLGGLGSQPWDEADRRRGRALDPASSLEREDRDLERGRLPGDGACERCQVDGPPRDGEGLDDGAVERVLGEVEGGAHEAPRPALLDEHESALTARDHPSGHGASEGLVDGARAALEALAKVEGQRLGGARLAPSSCSIQVGGEVARVDGAHLDGGRELLRSRREGAQLLSVRRADDPGGGRVRAAQEVAHQRVPGEAGSGQHDPVPALGGHEVLDAVRYDHLGP